MEYPDWNIHHQYHDGQQDGKAPKVRAQQLFKQLQGVLEKAGVKEIEALGQEFDPNFHNAVMQVESDEYEEGVIAQELLKGYTYRDTVVRYSMVAVTQ